MPAAATPRLGLIAPAGTDAVALGDDQVRALANQLDAVVPRFAQGLLSARPTSTAGSPGITGRLFYATDVGLLFYDYGTGWAPQGIAIGAMLDWAGAGDLSTELVVCDGRTLARTTYASLFNALGGASSPWGLPSGTTFQIPDLRGRTTVSPDGSAGRLGAFGPDTLGATGGEEAHILGINELPDHAHGLTSTTAVGAVHTGTGVPPHNNTAVGGLAIRFAGGVKDLAGGNVTVNGPHNNMPPYAVVNKVMRIA